MKIYSDEYEFGLIDDKILYEIVLGQDLFKSESFRSSTKILDFLGDIGGFYATVDIMLFLFGNYFSAKFFFNSIANSLYIRKKTKSELAGTKLKKHPKRHPKRNMSTKKNRLEHVDVVDEQDDKQTDKAPSDRSYTDQKF